MKRFIEEFEEIREELYINTTEDDYAPGGTFGDEVIAFDEGLTREGKAMRSWFNGEALKSWSNHWRGDHPVANDICAAAFIIALDKYRTRQIDERLEKFKRIKKRMDDNHKILTKIIFERSFEYFKMEEADKWTQEITLEDTVEYEKELDKEAEEAYQDFKESIQHLAMITHRIKVLENPDYYFKI